MKKILIPFGLIGLWVALLAIQMLIIEKSFTLITENYDREVVKINVDKMNAEIVAKDNYLGIVSVNFDQRNKMLKGIISFRIKEVGASDWYYVNDYNAEQLNDLPFYPFGFPIIEDSKNKKYEVSIELKNTGAFKNTLKLNKNNPTITTSHKYPKAPLLESNKAFVAFLYKKILNIIHNNYQVFGSIVCMYPFLFYFFALMAEKKYLRKVLLGIIVLTVFFDAIFIFQFFDMAYITVAGMWFLILKSQKNHSHYSYCLAFTLMIFCMIAQILNNNNIVEKSASWAFLFIVLALVQDAPGLRSKK